MGSAEAPLRNLSEAEAYDLLEQALIRVPRTRVAATAEEAAQAASAIGFPVVVKVASADILHKSKLGGVEVGLKSPDSVIGAFGRIVANCRRAAPEAKIDGCLISQMALPGLAEVIVGTTRDAEFGRVIMFGAGGEYAEVLKCVDFRSVPVTQAEALKMVAKIQERMKAAAGWKRINPAVPAELIVRFSDLLVKHPEIESIDINPAIIYADHYVVVDAKGTATKD